MKIEQQIDEFLALAEKATPGPWKIETPLDRTHDDLFDDQPGDWSEDYPVDVTVIARWADPGEHGVLGWQICEMSGVHDHTIANARLMADARNRAAPLLRALRALLEMNTAPFTPELIDAADAAIREAEKEEQ